MSAARVAHVSLSFFLITYYSHPAKNNDIRMTQLLLLTDRQMFLSHLLINVANGMMSLKQLTRATYEREK